MGDPRSNQNPALLSFGILFFKWHNTVAGRIQAENPTWTDEEIFQRARRFVIATLQVRLPLDQEEILSIPLYRVISMLTFQLMSFDA